MLARLFRRDGNKATTSGGAEEGAATTTTADTASTLAGGSCPQPQSHPHSTARHHQHHQQGNDGHVAITRQLDPTKDAGLITKLLQTGTQNISSVCIPHYRVKGSYVEYVVECTRGNACWRVFRRYQQFKTLDQALRPLSTRGTPQHGDYGVLPVLPSSHWMEVTNQSPELVDRRRRFLEIYLQQLLVPRNFFYVARTPLYAFLHDGEVAVDVRVVSVQPLLGLATLTELDSSAAASTPFHSPDEMPLTEDTANTNNHSSSVNCSPVAVGIGAAGSQEALTASNHIPALVGGPASPIRTVEDGAFLSGARAEEEDGQEGDSTTTSSTTSSSSSSSADTERREEGVDREAAPRASQHVTAAASPDSLPSLEEGDVTPWDNDDAPSEDDLTVSLHGALADERLPPPAPNCLQCNGEFSSALYPHRCYLCRCRFCRNCLWRLRVATTAVGPQTESLCSPLRAKDRRKRKAKPGVVNACLQCAENYMRRWNRHNPTKTAADTAGTGGDKGSTNAFSSRPQPSVARTICQQPPQGMQEHPLMCAAPLQPPQRGANRGLTSSPVTTSMVTPEPSSQSPCSSPTTTTTATDTRDHMEPSYGRESGAGLPFSPAAVSTTTFTAPLCTPSLRFVPSGPKRNTTTTAAATTSTGNSLHSTRLSIMLDTSIATGDVEDATTSSASGAPVSQLLQPYLGKLSVLQKPIPMRVGLGDFQLLTSLGRGTFGRVMKVRLRATDTVYAMKVMNKSVVYKRYMTSYIKEEKSILTTLPPHPYVVRCYFAFQSDYYLFFVLDYLSGGELYNLIYPTLRITPEETQLYAAELVLAIEHIHKYDVVHRDIKPENIVLTKEGHLKLTDFGLARKNFSHTRRRSFVGSAEYVAPETIHGEYQTPALDWWSLGVLLYEMLAGQAPFHADNNNAVYENVVCKEVDLHDERAFSPEAASLIRGLLTRDVATRLQDPNVIRAHAYFTGVDWHALRQGEVPAPRVPYLADNDVRHFKRDFTSEWASVPPPPHQASRNSIDMLNRCFDNFPIAPDASRPADTNTANTTTTTANSNSRNSNAGGVAGTMPPLLDLDSAGSSTESVTAPLAAPAGTAVDFPALLPSPCMSAAQVLLSQQPPRRPLSSTHLCSSRSYSQADLLGVWRLLKVETCALDGRVIYPWGGDVLGLLVYLPSGDYGLQLSPLRRRRLRHRSIGLAAKEELCDIFCSYAAQFGTFTVPAVAATVAMKQPTEKASSAHQSGGNAVTIPPVLLTSVSTSSLPRACSQQHMVHGCGQASEREEGMADDGDEGTLDEKRRREGAEAEEEDELDVYATAPVVLHHMEANLVPNLAQRTARMRFEMETTGGKAARQSQQQYHHTRGPSTVCAVSEDSHRGGGGGGASAARNTTSITPTAVAARSQRSDSPLPQPTAANLEDDETSSTASARRRQRPRNTGPHTSALSAAAVERVVLRLATEPERVASEPFRARTILTWVRVKAFAAPAMSVATQAAPAHSESSYSLTGA